MKKPLSNKTKFNRAVYFFIALLGCAVILNLFSFLNSAKGNVKSNIKTNNLEGQTRVVDGDTIGIVTEKKVRFACLDSIEKSQELGEKSIAYLEGVLGTSDNISYHYYGVDNFGRIIAEVYIQDKELHKFTNVNLLMIESGYAIVESGYGDCLNMNKYYQAQKEAKDNQRGLWAKEEVCFPSDYRKKLCDF